MADEPNKFTHIGVLDETQRRISILARVANGGQGINIYKMVDDWSKEAWQEALQAGVVTDAMLKPAPAHWVKPTVTATKKRRPQRVGSEQ